MAKKVVSKKFKNKKYQARQQREAQQTRIILIVTIVIGALILGLIGYGLINQLIIRPRVPVAQVGDTVIRVNEFESQVKYTRVQMLNQTFQYYSFYQQFGEFGGNFLQTAQSLASQLSQPVTLGRDVLDQMIDDVLIRDAAAERGITASEDEIEEALQAAFGFFPDGTPTPSQTATIVNTPTLSETSLALVTLTPSATPQEPQTVFTPTPFDNSDQEVAPTQEVSPTVTLTPTPFTTEVFGQNLQEFNELYNPYDFNLADLRQIFEVQILRDKLQDEVVVDLVPVKEEVWARHILVESEEQAQEVLEALEAGESFDELAAEYSIDESNKNQGGDLGWFDRETMVSEFAEVAFSLEKGEISDPVSTAFGFHLIQVISKRESQVPPQEFELMTQNAFANWLLEQRSTRDDIVIYDEWEEFVPNRPEIPQEFLFQLYQEGQ